MSLLLLAAAVPVIPAPAADIVVTAAREPVEADAAPVSATIFAEEELERLGLPAATDLLRLAPGVSVASSGPRGSQAQVRIRGAEANHSLLFVDGIRFNDPAAGNEARFELLGTDLLSRFELVRGPQSALWGSEALGGVIAVDSPDPFRRTGLTALAEYGSHDSARLAGQAALRSGDLGLSASGAYMRSDGIDSFGSSGERDGFDQRAASLRAAYRPADGIEMGLAGHWVSGTSEFDGFDPASFQRADTLDETENRIAAIRGWAEAEAGGFTIGVDASLLDSSNRNRLDDDPLNRTAGRRSALGGQVSRRIGSHLLIAAAEYERETFRARDQAYFGATEQDRARSVTAFVGQWREEWAEWLVTDLALRRDHFSAFADATTVRAAALVRPMPGLSFHASYGEGVAQPTFFDLYGFFPGSFAGNPDLGPERSRGWEAGATWQQGAISLGATYFRARLTDEIVDVFDPATFLSSTENAEGRSRREGVELTGRYRFSPAATVELNYTFLDAEEQKLAGDLLLRETRRPRHSANLIATGSSGPLNWGAGISWVGARSDMDFDLFPAQRVRLDDYLLSSLRIGYEVAPALEAFGRIENALDADYQDVVGYNTAGRTVHAGLRWSPRL